MVVDLRGQVAHVAEVARQVRLRGAAIVLVGQAAARSTVGKQPLNEGATSRRLATLLGMNASEYEQAFARHNVLGRVFPGKMGKGDAFPVARARRGATSLQASHVGDGDVVVALGRGVARSFGVPTSTGFFEWFVHPADDPRFHMVVVPHPSGISHWWNSRTNRLAARCFFRWLASLKGFGHPAYKDVPASVRRAEMELYADPFLAARVLGRSR